MRQNDQQVLFFGQRFGLREGRGSFRVFLLRHERLPLVEELLQAGDLLLLLLLLLNLLLRFRIRRLFLGCRGPFFLQVKVHLGRISQSHVMGDVKQGLALRVLQRDLVVADGQTHVNVVALLVRLGGIMSLDVLAVDHNGAFHAGVAVIQRGFTCQPARLGSKGKRPADQRQRGRSREP